MKVYSFWKVICGRLICSKIKSMLMFIDSIFVGAFHCLDRNFHAQSGNTHEYFYELSKHANDSWRCVALQKCFPRYLNEMFSMLLSLDCECFQHLKNAILRKSNASGWFRIVYYWWISCLFVFLAMFGRFIPLATTHLPSCRDKLLFINFEPYWIDLNLSW